MGRGIKSKTISYRVPFEFHLALLREQQKAVKKMSRQDILRQWAAYLRSRR